jgi:hypothetical protein
MLAAHPNERTPPWARHVVARERWWGRARTTRATMSGAHACEDRTASSPRPAFALLHRAPTGVRRSLERSSHVGRGRARCTLRASTERARRSDRRRRATPRAYGARWRRLPRALRRRRSTTIDPQRDLAPPRLRESHRRCGFASLDRLQWQARALHRHRSWRDPPPADLRDAPLDRARSRRAMPRRLRAEWARRTHGAHRGALSLSQAARPAPRAYSAPAPTNTLTSLPPSNRKNVPPYTEPKTSNCSVSGSGSFGSRPLPSASL